MTKAKKTVIRTKTYVVKHEVHSDGTITELRQCCGFNPWELLGICERIRKEIHQQMDKELKPPQKITRQAVK